LQYKKHALKSRNVAGKTPLLPNFGSYSEITPAFVKKYIYGMVLYHNFVKALKSFPT
jgi:hypothetical protein